MAVLSIELFRGAFSRKGRLRTRGSVARIELGLNRGRGEISGWMCIGDIYWLQLRRFLCRYCRLNSRVRDSEGNENTRWADIYCSGVVLNFFSIMLLDCRIFVNIGVKNKSSRCK